MKAAELHRRNLTHPIEAAVVMTAAILLGLATGVHLAPWAAVFWTGFYYGREVRDMEMHEGIRFTELLNSDRPLLSKGWESYRVMVQLWRWTRGSLQDLAYPAAVCVAMTGLSFLLRAVVPVG